MITHRLKTQLDTLGFIDRGYTSFNGFRMFDRETVCNGIALVLNVTFDLMGSKITFETRVISHDVCPAISTTSYNRDIDIQSEFIKHCDFLRKKYDPTMLCLYNMHKDFSVGIFTGKEG